MHKSAVSLVAVLALATVSAAFAGRAYADAPDGIPPYVSQYCPNINLRPPGHLGTHSLTLYDGSGNPINNGDTLPSGTTVNAVASATPGAGIDNVIFLWYDGTNVIVSGPKPIGFPNPGNLPASVSDPQTFTPPNPTGYEITACFTSKQRDNQGTLIVITKHINVGSFMVLPESAIGALALATAPIAALGFYLYRKNGLN